MLYAFQILGYVVFFFYIGPNSLFLEIRVLFAKGISSNKANIPNISRRTDLSRDFFAQVHVANDVFIIILKQKNGDFRKNQHEKNKLRR